VSRRITVDCVPLLVSLHRCVAWLYSEDRDLSSILRIYYAIKYYKSSDFYRSFVCNINDIFRQPEMRMLDL
jgi:hypothetical protein